MFEAKSIMRTDVFTVNEHTSIYDAMMALVEHGVTGLPVVDEKNILKGIITEKDCLSLLVDSNVEEKQVSSFMTVDIVSFGLEDSATEIAEFFIKYPYRKVPIVDKGVLMGIISRKDIIKLILAIRGKSEE